MTVDIIRANQNHAEALSTLMRSVWADISLDPAYIHSLLAQPDRATYLAVEGGQLIGFVDGFMTQISSQEPRWEVDLLGVHPDYRGRGMATALVKKSTQFGKQAGAHSGRCLIAAGNTGSEKAFAHSGYQSAAEAGWLYVFSEDQAPPVMEQAIGLRLIPVQTLNYRGLWIEDVFSPACLAAGAAERIQRQVDVAGAVIPESSGDSIAAAEKLGFKLVGQYRYWYCDLAQ
ncbi:MAG: GNAT family N-acetyltransferase [Anaerolineae bacterium]|nr:GNAT family N-acetyltransferase [Anaerolineae bacterium]